MRERFSKLAVAQKTMLFGSLERKGILPKLLILVGRKNPKGGDYEVEKG